MNMVDRCDIEDLRDTLKMFSELSIEVQIFCYCRGYTKNIYTNIRQRICEKISQSQRPIGIFLSDQFMFGSMKRKFSESLYNTIIQNNFF